MQSFKAFLFVLAVQLYYTNGELKNCTSSPCDIKTCQNTTTTCKQVCSATPCSTSCQSPAGCTAECPLGGCSKMACEIADNNMRKSCTLTCKKNCSNMDCKSYVCKPECAEDNCKLNCHSNAATGECYPRCRGKGCEINCRSTYCEAICAGGNCMVKFGKNTFGSLGCSGGGCTLICPKGKQCEILGCNNCTTKVVDDPFASSAGNSLAMAVHVMVFSIVSAFLSKLL